MQWVGGELVPADRLILEDLLPIAREGLQASHLNQGDIDLYLDTIEERVRSGHTGSQWQIVSLSSMGTKAPLSERMSAVTAAIASRQKTGEPVAHWELAELAEGGGWKQNYLTVERCMDTDLVTVEPTEPVDLVANLMVWNNIRHVMVENADNQLVGMVSQRALIKLVGTYDPEHLDGPLPVSEIMLSDPVTVTPETSTVEAIDTMRSNGWSCLPVIKNGHLVGVLTEGQLMAIAGQLLEQNLRE
jgi:CBS domain-containing protein